ncbi:MAG: DUF3034 family protein [Aquabacterium sp.]
MPTNAAHPVKQARVAKSLPRASQAWRLGWLGLAAVAACMAPKLVHAGDKILGTWGVSQVEGAGGGGLVPWATITGTGSSNQNGGSVFVTHLQTQGGYQLKVGGAALGIKDKVELSMARWSLKLSDVVPGKSLEMNVAGAKFKVVGDAVYDQDTLMPQISVGAQYKQSDDSELVKTLGAVSASDIDVYATATKLWLGGAAGRNVLATVTTRLTRANQFGLAGFGGPGRDQRKLQLEGSLGVMVRDDLVLGAEYRTKPNNLAVSSATDYLREEDAWDLFMAWFPCRGGSLTLAWVNLGNIVSRENQSGLYVSAQAAF